MKNEKLEEVEKRMREGVMTPHEMADMRIYLAGEYSYLSGQLERILFSKPEKWMTLREGTKSDTSAERAWDATEDGKQEMSIRLTLKRIEKMLSAANSALRIAEQEARNVI